MERTSEESIEPVPAKRRRVPRQLQHVVEATRSQSPKNDDMLTIEKLQTEEKLEDLIRILKTEGFSGNFQELQEKFAPGFAPSLIKRFFNDLTRWRDPLQEDPTIERNSAVEETNQKMAPIEEWISSIRDSIEVQRLASFPAIMMDWIAKFEEHPDPKDSCGVDYQAIYFYIAELLEGRIPKQLNAPTASKLYMIFQKLVKTIRMSAEASQDLVVQTAKIPTFKTRIEREEKNRLLRERRRTTWSAEEEKQASIIKTAEIDEVKELYCNNTGLNPFSFPSNI